MAHLSSSILKMKERINRKSDENLYQPKIHSERIKALYRLKQQTGKPMTVLLDQAICDLTGSYHAGDHLEEEPILEAAEIETWEEVLEYRQLLDQLDYLKCLNELEKIKDC